MEAECMLRFWIWFAIGFLLAKTISVSFQWTGVFYMLKGTGK